MPQGSIFFKLEGMRAQSYSPIKKKKETLHYQDTSMIYSSDFGRYVFWRKYQTRWDLFASMRCVSKSLPIGEWKIENAGSKMWLKYAGSQGEGGDSGRSGLNFHFV